jgi:GNAT superfamily N-acetyltransferase
VISSLPTYAIEATVSVEEFRLLLTESGLGVRRPVDEPERLQAMLRNANLVVTARTDGVLVGIARSVTDFAFCCYLSDLAVSRQAQGKGVGAGLIQATRKHIGPNVSLILSSVPESVGFYESIGMAPLPNGFWQRRER